MNINQYVSSDPSEHPVTVALRAIGFTELNVEPIKPEEEKGWNKLMRKHHYLKEHRLVGESIRYVAKQNGRWIALLGWSSSAFHLQDRDAWIGWSDAQRQTRRHLVACNSRFLILQKKSQNPNAASQRWRSDKFRNLAQVSRFSWPQRGADIFLSKEWELRAFRGVVR
jgi:Domain of unknown function (DUF4338)